jgi:hypothetical protein
VQKSVTMKTIKIDRKIKRRLKEYGDKKEIGGWQG